MRWRVLMNSLDRTGARDTLERLSLAIDQIGPYIAIGLFIPMAVVLAGTGAYAGYAMATTSRALAFEIVRILLAIMMAMSIIGPILMPSMERASAVRLLLLPIRRETLYVAQASSALSEPWVLMALPPVLAMPLGMAAGGAIGAAVIALAGGLLLILTLVSIVALVTTVLHLIVRDRRRGELIMLLFVLIVPALSMLPGLWAAGQTRAERRSERAAQAERIAHGEETSSDRLSRLALRATTLIPSELYVRATRTSVRGEISSAAMPLGALAATAIVLHTIGFFAFGRLLNSPGSPTRSRARSSGSWSSLRLPGLSRGAAAVAQAHLRLILRTPRGRSTVLAPTIVFVLVSILAKRHGGMDIGPVGLSNGLGVATFGAGVSLLSILPIGMNQFAVDRAGLTLALLTPLDTRQLLIGKAVGNGIAAAIPSLLSVVFAFLWFRDGSLALWLSLPLGLIATYLLVAPAAAALSAIFPRAVDMNSVGSRSNAHGLANLFGMASFGAASLPPTFLTMLALMLKMPVLAPVLLAIWCLVAWILSRLLLNAVARLFEKRRENLALTTRPAN